MTTRDDGHDEPQADAVDPAASEGSATEPAEPELVLDPPTPSEADALRVKLEEAQARLRTVSKAFTDLQGEMDAFRARMENQGRAKAERQAFETVQAFLDPVQNLKRCIAAPGDDVGNLVAGLQMVQHQFMDALTRLGLQQVPGEGSDFDPRWHEALAVTPVADASQDGKVLVVHQGGWQVNGRVLQAAQVVIGKHEQAAEA